MGPLVCTEESPPSPHNTGQRFSTDTRWQGSTCATSVTRQQWRRKQILSTAAAPHNHLFPHLLECFQRVVHIRIVHTIVRLVVRLRLFVRLVLPFVRRVILQRNTTAEKKSPKPPVSPSSVRDTIMGSITLGEVLQLQQAHAAAVSTRRDLGDLCGRQGYTTQHVPRLRVWRPPVPSPLALRPH